MRTIVFIGDAKYPSFLMRGKQVSEKLVELGYKSSISHKPDGITNSLVILVKTTLSYAKALKAQNNVVIYDIVDALCVPKIYNSLPTVWNYLDGIIVPNKDSISRIKELAQKLPPLPMTVIYHHWDPRLLQIAKTNKKNKGLVFGYLGDYGSISKGLIDTRPLMIKYPIKILDCNNGKDMTREYFAKTPVRPALNEKDNMSKVLQIHQSLDISCHLNLRLISSNEALYKPGVKVATASVLGCNFITTPDSSTIEILGKDYPYLIKSLDPVEVEKMLNFVKTTYGGEIWNKGLGMINRVKTLTSLNHIVKDYISLGNKYK